MSNSDFYSEIFSVESVILKLQAIELFLQVLIAIYGVRALYAAPPPTKDRGKGKNNRL